MDKLKKRQLYKEILPIVDESIGMDLEGLGRGLIQGIQTFSG
jgi:hypothetical protein